MAHSPPQRPQDGGAVSINGRRLCDMIDQLRLDHRNDMADELQYTPAELPDFRRCRICEQVVGPKEAQNHRCWGEKAEDDHLLALCLTWLVERFPESTNADALALREFVAAQNEEKTS